MKFLNSLFIKAGSTLSFDTSNTTEAQNAGEVLWNPVDGTLNIRLYNGVTLQDGQELHIYGKASGNITNKQVVMFGGAEGDHLLLVPANGAILRANPHYIVGIATQDITNGSFGYITWFGKVNKVDTSMWTSGSVLYYDATLNNLSSIMPIAPDPKVVMCAVLRSDTQVGSLLVRPDFGRALNMLNDVHISSATAGQTILWNATLGRWENGDIVAATLPITAYPKTISSNTTLSASSNHLSVGPITINDGVVVTIEDGAIWTII